MFFDPDARNYRGSRGSGLFSEGQSDRDGQDDLTNKLSNHFKEIDLVLGSNFDEKTKQKMIQEIQ